VPLGKRFPIRSEDEALYLPDDALFPRLGV
jgi:hypothetical protein